METSEGLLEVRFNRKKYLSLLPVNQAYLEVTAHAGFEKVLGAFSDVMHQEGQGSKFGLFLLHRHFLPPLGTEPIERILHWGVTPELSLVTQMIARDNLECYPSRWAYDTNLNRFEALEFSCDYKVKEAWQFLLSRKGLMIKIGNLLVENKIDHLLGFTVADREIMPKDEDKCLIESSEKFAGASILQVKQKPNIRPETMIPTVWVPVESCWCHEKYSCHQWCWGYGSNTDCANVEHEQFSEGHDVVPCV